MAKAPVINFADGENGTVDDKTPIKATGNRVPALPNVTPNNGYEFNHWEDQYGFLVDPGDYIDADSTLKPVFREDGSHAIDFAPGEHGTIDDNSPIRTDKDGVVPGLPTVTPDDGYEFDYWEDQHGNPVKPGDKLDNDATLKPVFRDDGSHTIDFVPGEHGTIDDDSPIKTDKDGVILELPSVTPDNGYMFDHWEDQNGNPVKPGDKLDNDTILKPVFRIDNYVSIVPIPGETLTPQEAQAAGWKYGPYGEELQITGFSNTAYKRDIEVPSHIGDFSIVRIGDDVFSGQSGLRKIIIPDSITSIGTSAFENCAGLTELTMNNVVEMGDSACKGCTKLVEVEGSFRTVGSSAFEECTSLKSIDLSSVSSLGKNAFKNCIELTNANISDSVTEIPEGAFQGCSKVCSINLPESVTSIGDRAFDGCESLTDDLVTLPKSVTSLGALAFANTNLSTQIYFGKKGPGKDYATLAAVSSRIPLNTPYRIFVGPGLVVNDNAYGLKEWQHETGKNLSICTSNFKDGDTIYAYIDEKTPEPPSLEASPQSWFVSDGKGTLLGTSDEYNNLVNAPTDLVVPKSLGGAVITTIGEAAFADKSLLTSIVLPDTVRSFGPRAFAGCTSATVFVSKISEPNWDKWAAHNCWNAFSRVKNIVVDKLSDIPANYYLGALDTGTQVYTSKGKAPYNVSYTKVSLPSTGTVPPLFIKNPPAREGIGRVVAYTDYSFIDLGGVTPTGNSSYEKHYITVNKGSDKPTGAYAYSKYQGGGYKQTTSIEILWNWFNITVNGKSFRWGPLKRFEEHVEFT